MIIINIIIVIIVIIIIKYLFKKKKKKINFQTLINIYIANSLFYYKLFFIIIVIPKPSPITAIYYHKTSIYLIKCFF